MPRRKSTLRYLIRYIGGIVFDRDSKSGESGEGEGGTGRFRPAGSSDFLGGEHRLYMPHLFLRLQVTIEEWNDGVLLIRVTDTQNETPIMGISVWSEDGKPVYSVDDPA